MLVWRASMAALKLAWRSPARLNALTTAIPCTYSTTRATVWPWRSR